MVRADPERLPRNERRLSDRMENGGIGAVVDDGMGARGIEPAFREITPQPFRNEDGVVRQRVGLAQQRVHERGLLALVALVDAVQDLDPRMAALVVADGFRPEGLAFQILARIDQDHDVHLAAQVVLHAAAPPPEASLQLMDEDAAAAPRSEYRFHADGHRENGRRGAGFPPRRAHAAPRAAALKRGRESPVGRGTPRRHGRRLGAGAGLVRFRVHDRRQPSLP